MDLFNIEKCRTLETMLDKERQKVKELTTKLMGGRVCGGYCFVCENDIAATEQGCFGKFIQHYCKLNCNCGEFVEKKSPLLAPPKED